LREHEECMAARDLLISEAEKLELPPNFLDELIDELGGPGMVAEMTGRRGRVVRKGGRRIAVDSTLTAGSTVDSTLTAGSTGLDVGAPVTGSGTLVYEARAEAKAVSGRAAAGSIAGDGEVEGVNLQEKSAFNKGDKLVAIISDAASTGISLHALKGAGNSRRRDSKP